MSEHERDRAATYFGRPGRDVPPRASPFYPEQKALDANFRDLAGWAAPAWYGANETRSVAGDVPDHPAVSPAAGVEHLATRSGVGCYDLTPHTPIEIHGPSSTAFLQRLFTNDMAIDVGGVRFTLLLDEAGGIRGDLVVTRVTADAFVAIAGPSGGAVVGEIRQRAPDDVRVIGRDAAFAALGVWGPETRDLLDPLTDQDLTDDGFPYFTSRRFHVGDVPVLGLRISAVGELGWELWTTMPFGARLWETLRAAGADHGLVAVGHRAFSSLSAEKGTRMSGTDLGVERNPYEAGLEFAVAMDTPFVGRDALRVARTAGIDRRMTCLTVDPPDRPVAVGADVLAEGAVIGRVIRSDYGYTVDERIAYAYLPVAHVVPGAHVRIQMDGEHVTGTVREEPLFDPDNERMAA